MKKIVLFAVVFAMALALGGCGKTGFDPAELTESEFNDAELNSQVELYVKQKTVTTSTEEVALALVNLTEKDFSYDANQRLEVELDGKWYVVPNDQAGVVLAIYTLPAGGTETELFVFKDRYDSLPQGSYRIIKQFVDEEGEIALAAAQFRIG